MVYGNLWKFVINILYLLLTFLVCNNDPKVNIEITLRLITEI